MMEFIKSNPDKVWVFLTTMGATIIGAITSYIATTQSEKRKEKRALQKARLTDVLIPYCASLEEAILALSKLNSETNLDYFQSLIEVPLHFLKVEKRVYLNRSQCDKLKQYEKVAFSFMEEWYKGEKQFRKKYCNWIARQTEAFYLNTGLGIYVSMKEREDSKGDLFNILEKKAPKFVKQQITGIQFVQNDDSENYRLIDVRLDEEIWNLFGAIVLGLETAEEQEPDIELSIQLAEFLNGIDDAKILNQLINSTDVKEKRDMLLRIAKNNRDDLVRYIDKISG